MCDSFHSFYATALCAHHAGTRFTVPCICCCIFSYKRRLYLSCNAAWWRDRISWSYHGDTPLVPELFALYIILGGHSYTGRYRVSCQSIHCLAPACCWLFFYSKARLSVIRPLRVGWINCYWIELNLHNRAYSEESLPSFCSGVRATIPPVCLRFLTSVFALIWLPRSTGR